MFVFNKMNIIMKKILFFLAVGVFAVSFFACSDTTDCYCEYGNGESTMVNDWNGDCSEISIIELTKKAAPGQSLMIGCIEQ